MAGSTVARIPDDYPVLEYNINGRGPVLSHIEAINVMRRSHPFVRNSFSIGYWVLTSAEVIKEALQRPELFSNSAPFPLEPEPEYTLLPEMLDPPEHTAWRQLLAPHFSPRRVAAMEAKVRRRCREIIEPLAKRGYCDFLSDFASRYPTTLFMEQMGLPANDLDQFLAWEHEFLHLTTDEDPDRSRALGATFEVMGYFQELIEQKRRNPGADLLTEALSWTIDEEPIGEHDMLSWCLLMFTAGLDTVTTQLAYMFWYLAQHDDDRARADRGTGSDHHRGRRVPPLFLDYQSGAQVDSRRGVSRMSVPLR